MPTTTGVATEFITFTRASNATVTDSDGKVKWAPHNLLLASESFDAASWLKVAAASTVPTVTANAAVAPNGTTTAETVALGAIDAAGDVSVVSQTFTAVDATYGGGVYVKAATGGDVGKKVWMFMYDSAYRGVASVTLTTEWQLLSSTATLTAGSNRELGIATLGSTYGGENQGAVSVLLWGASLYRSDLGGMQPNTSAYPMYNPTTVKNMVGYTEDFSNAYWAKSGLSAFGSGSTSNAAVNPVNGLQTADKITAAATTETHYVLQQRQTIANTERTYSIYAKYSTAQYIAFGFLNGTVGTAWAFATVDILNGTITQTTVGPGGSTTATSAITPVGNGWHRISIKVNCNNADTYVGIHIVNSATPTFGSYGLYSWTANGTESVNLWGAQLSDSASLDPYVPVYGAAVTSAAYYGPRRDFDGATLACKGLLVEEQRTNLVRYSRTLETTGSYWGGLASGTANTVTIDNAPGPDGLSTSASMITYNTAVTGAGTYSAWRHTLSTTANGTYTFTIWLKAGTTSSVYLRFSDSGGNRANTLCTLTSSWQRFTVTGTTAASITTISCDVGADGNAGGQTLTAGTVYAYGAQLELGSFATSYVPNGLTVNGTTRNADVGSVSTQAFPYSATEGTLVANVSTFDTSSNLPTHINLSDGTTSNYIRMNAQPTSYKLRNYVRAGGADVVNSTMGGVTVVNDPFKAGVYYKANSFNSSVNGAISTEVTSGAVPSAATTLSLGNWFTSAGTFLNGHIRQITYLPRRVTNAELQTRTT